ncbi:MAG: diadenylate cyclase CdaA [Candidatus Latescibacteria bacterium]|nr:diadenylate cyclase CdaA [Candidatus Latescibacterota bacterium]
MELFKFGFIPIRLLDIIDIAIVALIFYMAYLRIKDTRAMQLITGLLILLAASFVAGWAKLNALNTLIHFFGSIWLIGIVVIFAPELRRLLFQIGRLRITGMFERHPEHKSIEEVVTAARQLSDKNYGALIIMTRNTQLGVVVDTGTAINADVSHQLLVTIFTPNSPLHDLAVIVRGDRIIAANCLLPLSESREIDRSLGSRHRAGLGITEETDAVVVIVSEETRAISLAVDGRLIWNLSPSDLRNNLISLLG